MLCVGWCKSLIFNEKNGGLRRTGTLFSNMETPENEKKPEDLVFLGARPTQEGHLPQGAPSLRWWQLSVLARILAMVVLPQPRGP